MTRNDAITLFAIPYAGGSAAAAYGRWARMLPPNIKLSPLELAGHGRRMPEPFAASLDAAVADLLATVLPAARSGAYAIYGHSMGTTVAYELIRALDAAGVPPPLTLFVSGRNPPHYPYPQRNLHMLDDDTFLAEIRKLGGTPGDFFKLRDLVKAFLPILRSDYRLIELHKLRLPEHTSDADIVFFHSDGDVLVSKPALDEWRRYTRGSLTVHEFHGGHFFINENAAEMCAIMGAQLNDALVRQGWRRAAAA